MKVILVFLGLIASCVSPKSEEELSAVEYTTKLGNLSITESKANAHRNALLAYYTKLNNAEIVKTLSFKGYAIDCVDFCHQPALIEASTEQCSNALNITKKHKSIYAGECPKGKVGIMRPRLAGVQAGGFRKVGRTKPKGVSQTSNKRLAQNMPTNISGFLYSWINNNDYNPSTLDNNLVFAILYNDFNYPNYPITRPNPFHSINQLWWITKGDQIQSLEAGLMLSGYFTETPSTSVFAFSTPDNYGPRDLLTDCDQNNTPGGFIQTGNFTLGTPIGTNGYLVSYFKDEQSNYQFYIVPIIKALSSGANTLGTPIHVGYWPKSHYDPKTCPGSLNSSPDFKLLSAGSEVLAINSTDSVGMFGTISGYGSYKISNDSFSLDPVAQNIIQMEPDNQTSGSKQSPCTYYWGNLVEQTWNFPVNIPVTVKALNTPNFDPCLFDCSTNCSGSTPVCNHNTKACVECTQEFPGICTAKGQVCDNTGKCVTCVTDQECPTNAPICNNGNCVQCTNTDDSFCIQKQQGCEVSTNTCKACTASSQCPGPIPVCDNGKCVQCTAQNRNGCSVDAPVCNVINNTCVQCVNDNDCPSIAPACDLKTNTCVQCTSSNNTLCAKTNTYCDEKNKQCSECTPENAERICPSKSCSSNKLCNCSLEDTRCPVNSVCGCTGSASFGSGPPTNCECAYAPPVS